MAYQKPKNPANCKKRVKMAIKKLKIRSSNSCPFWYIYFETHIDGCHQTVHQHVVEAKKGVEAVQPCIATSLYRILVEKDQNKKTFTFMCILLIILLCYHLRCSKRKNNPNSCDIVLHLLKLGWK